MAWWVVVRTAVRRRRVADAERIVACGSRRAAVPRGHPGRRPGAGTVRSPGCRPRCVAGAEVAGNGPPCTMAYPTSTPVGQPLTTTRPAFSSSSPDQLGDSAMIGFGQACTVAVSWPSRPATICRSRSRSRTRTTREVGPNTSSGQPGSARNVSPSVTKSWGSPGRPRLLGRPAATVTTPGVRRHRLGAPVECPGDAGVSIGLALRLGDRIGGGRRRCPRRDRPGQTPDRAGAQLPDAGHLDATYAARVLRRVGEGAGQQEHRVDAGHLRVDRDWYRAGPPAAAASASPRLREPVKPTAWMRGSATRAMPSSAARLQQRERALRKPVGSNGRPNGPADELGRARVRRVGFDDHRPAGGERRGGVTAGHREGQREVAGGEHRDRTQRDRPLAEIGFGQG